MNRASVFEWHKRFKEGRESVRDDDRCGRSRKRPALFKSGQWHFHLDNAPVHNSILVKDYSPHLAPCDFCLFPKLWGYRYETIEEMKEAVTKVIDTLTQEDFHGDFQKLLERYSKCIAVGGDYVEGD